MAEFVLRLGPYSPRKRYQNGRLYNIPKTSALPRRYIRLCPWEGEYVYLIASRAKKGIVETGRLHGGSTFLLACANTAVPIHSIDIAPKNDDLIRQYFSENSVGANVNLIVGDSQHGKYPDIGDVDVLFIDGDHSYEGCTNDLENWYPALAAGGHILLHDCYFGSPVQDAVIDFIGRHDVTIVQTPYIHATYWHLSCGSIAHLIKKA
jgi:predicted O-methyltransferase YrrM